MILSGPVGPVCKGHVLDVNLKPFERALKDMDSQLYVKWNPLKAKKHGCWEIRRAPETKSTIYQGTHEGIAYYKVAPVEFDLVHHILDCAFLNYDVIRKLKEMDTWGTPDFVSAMEAQEEAHREAQREKARQTLKYAIKQNKSAMRDFYEMAKSGINPAEVIMSTKWT